MPTAATLPWRNWLARSAVNRKVGGSSPPGSEFLNLFLKIIYVCQFTSFLSKDKTGRGHVRLAVTQRREYGIRFARIPIAAHWEELQKTDFFNTFGTHNCKFSFWMVYRVCNKVCRRPAFLCNQITIHFETRRQCGYSRHRRRKDFEKNRDDFDVDGQLDSIAPKVRSNPTARRRQIISNFHSFTMKVKVARLPTLSMGSSINH